MFKHKEEIVNVKLMKQNHPTVISISKEVSVIHIESGIYTKSKANTIIVQQQSVNKQTPKGSNALYPRLL